MVILRGRYFSYKYDEDEKDGLTIGDKAGIGLVGAGTLGVGGSYVVPKVLRNKAKNIALEGKINRFKTNSNYAGKILEKAGEKKVNPNLISRFQNWFGNKVKGVTRNIAQTIVDNRTSGVANKLGNDIVQGIFDEKISDKVLEKLKEDSEASFKKAQGLSNKELKAQIQELTKKNMKYTPRVYKKELLARNIAKYGKIGGITAGVAGLGLIGASRVKKKVDSRNNK